MDTLQETIFVAGGEPVEITVRFTRHGPILWEDEEDVDDFEPAHEAPAPPPPPTPQSSPRRIAAPAPTPAPQPSW